MTKITAFWQDFLDLVFPRCCEACRSSLSGNETFICTSCRITLPRVLPASHLAAVLTHKFAAYPAVAETLAYLVYTRRGPVQSLLKALKYQQQEALGNLLGALYATELLAQGRFPEADLIVPVPLHPRRLRERGFNQSQAFAEGLASITAIPVDATLLQRTIYTVTQTGKTKTDRIANVKGIFEVRKGVDLTDSTVLLVDDVLTTGATLESCIDTLTRHSCRKLFIMTIAAAQDY